jgi:hypothetical protein
MMFSMVSAFRISRTSPFPLIVDTWGPSPCGTALPSSMTGRDSGDYYDPSVALGLAPRRRSRIPRASDVSSMP